MSIGNGVLPIRCPFDSKTSLWGSRVRPPHSVGPKSEFSEIEGIVHPVEWGKLKTADNRNGKVKMILDKSVVENEKNPAEAMRALSVWSTIIMFGGVSLLLDWLGLQTGPAFAMGLLITLAWKVLVNFWIKRPPCRSIGGMEWTWQRWNAAMRDRKDLVARYGGAPWTLFVWNAVAQPKANKAIQLFFEKYEVLSHLENDTKAIEFFSANSFASFAKMMEKQHRILERGLVAVFVYLHFEHRVSIHANSIREKNPTNQGDDWQLEVAKYWAARGDLLSRDLLVGLLSSGGSDSGPVALVQLESRKAKYQQEFFEKQLYDDDARSLSPQVERDMRREELVSRIGFEQTAGLDQCIVRGEDFSRDSKVDRYYMKNFRDTLAKKFEGHCAKCGEGMARLEFDHFLVPKSRGGVFAMRHKDGYFVNNCIPLCRSCNASKGAKEAIDFFEHSELEHILKLSAALNADLNRVFADFAWDTEPQRRVS